MALFMNSLKHRIAEASGLPKDVLLGQPILTVLGCMEVGIENYRGIIESPDEGGPDTDRGEGSTH